MKQRVRARAHDDAALVPAELLDEHASKSIDSTASNAATVARAGVAAPAPLMRGALPQLQSAAGNRAVQRLVAPNATQLHPAGPHALPMVDEAEEYEVPDVHIPPPGTGKQIPARFRGGLERAFDLDFSGVRVREGTAAPQLGAVAYTRGSDIEFARGHYSPHTGSGQRLLAHELTHVVQQTAGRVPVPRDEDIPDAAWDAGVPVNNNQHLESEASRQGRRAAWGMRARIAGQRLTVSRPMLPVVQSSPVGRLAAAAQPPRD